MDAPENVRLVLNWSMRGVGIFILILSLVGLIGNKRLNEGGALPIIIFFHEDTFVVLQSCMQWQDI